MIKLIKVLLICLIMLVLYKMYPLWEVVENKIIGSLLPFFISFVLAYFLYPLKCFFKKRFSRTMSMVLIILIIILMIVFVSFIVIPLIYRESSFLINTFIYVVNYIFISFPNCFYHFKLLLGNNFCIEFQFFRYFNKLR